MDALKALDHPTAMEVFNEIRKTYPHMSLGTAYRHFQLMAEDGIIRRLSVPGSPDRFDINMEPHQHIHCLRCGRYYDVDESSIGDIDRSVEQATGFVVVDHSIHFNGVCPECRGGQNRDRKEP
jgi:Fe2+ or Zn2+ uptake regulation protein